MAPGGTGDGEGDSGRLLANRYRVIRQLGRGGMGTVCRAFDEVLGREVAVKELRAFSDAAGPELAELRARMRREARAAAKIQHPGVVAVHDVAEEDGRPVIVMELVDGPSLADLLDGGSVLEPREAAAVGARVADALDAAHRAGVLHRDVKPGNILLDPGRRVVLTDFGVASINDPTEATSARLTQSGALVGSLEYLAPERTQGGEPAPPADIWSLGATLFAAVEGTSPFQRNSMWTTLTAIVTEPLPEPRRAGPLAEVLSELMNKDPAARPTARRARELLTEVADGASLPNAGDTVTLHLRRVADRRSSGAPAPGQEPGSEPAAPDGKAADVADAAGAGAGEPSAAGPGAPERDRPRRRAARETPRRPAARRVSLAGVVAVLVLGAVLATNAFVRNGESAVGAAGAPGNGAVGGPRTTPGPPAAGKSPDGHAVSPSPPRKKTASPSPKPTRRTAKPPTASNPGRSGSNGKPDPGPGPGAAPLPAPAPPAIPPGDPVCDPSSDGSYECRVLSDRPTFDDNFNEVGEIDSGPNSVYCQADLGRRETVLLKTNFWWVNLQQKGSSGVWINAIHISGGSNDEPLPGLPIC